MRRKKKTVMITFLTIVFRSWSFSFPHTPFCTHKRTDWWSPPPLLYCDVVPVCWASVYGVFWIIFSLAQGRLLHRQEKGQNRRKSIRLLDKQSLHLHQWTVGERERERENENEYFSHSLVPHGVRRPSCWISQCWGPEM